jgi:hypothetical protein
MTKPDNSRARPHSARMRFLPVHARPVLRAFFFGCGSFRVTDGSGPERVLALRCAGVEPLVLAGEVEGPLCAAPDYVRTGAVGSVWPGLAGARGVIVT